MISKGNSKLGKIPSFSLLPHTTCAPGVPCAVRGRCYAHRLLYTRPSVRDAWGRNTLRALAHDPTLFEEIGAYLEKERPTFFRVHVGGDFPDQWYFDQWVEVARRFPGTHFLAFTKRFTLDYGKRPANLAVVFSMWPGMVKPRAPRGIQFAWMQDGTENRVPKSAVPCPGRCDACGACWHLGRAGVDAVFRKH